MSDGVRCRIKQVQSSGSTTVVLDMDMGLITSIDNNIETSLTSSPIPTQPSENTFRMDTGVKQSYTLAWVRIQPDNYNDASSDSADWSNGHWLRMLKTLVNRWQAKTDGVKFEFTPTDQTLYPRISVGDLGVNGYITSFSDKWNSESLTKLSGSLTVGLGGMTANYGDDKAIVYWINIPTDTQSNQAHVPGSYTAISYPSGWVGKWVGKTFSTWNTAINGAGTNVAAGSSVYGLFSNSNGDLNLYAKYVDGWVVRYNANNGAGSMSPNTIAKPSGTLTLPQNGFNRPIYNFSKWAIDSVSGTQYNPGDSVNITGDTTFYATWTIDPAYSDYIPIASIDMLQRIGDGQQYTIGGTTYTFSPSAKYVLTQNLIFNDNGESNFTPLCSLSSPFTGTFDGAGCYIKGIRPSASRQAYNTIVVNVSSLFAAIGGAASIRNLWVRNGNFKSELNEHVVFITIGAAGSICGIVMPSATATIENCLVDNCSSISRIGGEPVPAHLAFAGQICAAAYNGQVSINNCACISCSTSSRNIYSGIEVYSGIIMGGGFGNTPSASISRCFVINSNVSGDTYNGPIYGMSPNVSTYCYYNNVSGINKTVTNGSEIQSNALLNQSSYSGFDFSSIWYIGDQSLNDMLGCALPQKFRGNIRSQTW